MEPWRWSHGDGACSAWVSLGKLPSGMECLPSHSRADNRNVTQGLPGNPGTQQQFPSSPLQGALVGACAALAQAEIIALFGGVGGAKLPGKGTTGASPGVCLSQQSPGGDRHHYWGEVPQLCTVKGTVRSLGISNHLEQQ